MSVLTQRSPSEVVKHANSGFTCIFTLASVHLFLVACLILVDSTYATEASEEEQLPIDDSVSPPPPPQSTTTPPPLMCSVCACPKINETGSLKINCNDQRLSVMPQWNQTFLNDAVDGDLSLILDGNDLKVVPIFPKILRLKVISIAKNAIESIEPYAFGNLQRLERLSLASNKISRLKSKAFAGIDDKDLPLKELDLSYNALRTLNNNLFDHVPLLDKLYLHHNSFSNIDSSTVTAFNHLHDLTALSLAWNTLRSLPEGLNPNPMSTITFLDLAGNNFTSIPPVLQLATNLQNLNLNSNPFTIFRKNDFEGLVNLAILNISVMPELTAIQEETFASTYHLHTLWCSYNPKLRYISPHAFPKDEDKLGQDLQLYLNNNNLSTLSKKMIRWVGVTWLDIQGNPFVCDCHTGWIRELQLWKKNPELTLQINCSSPPEAKNKRMLDVDEEVFTKCQKLADPPTNPAPSTKLDDDPPSARSTLGISLILGAVLAVGIIATLFIVGYIIRRRRQLALAPKPRVRYVKARISEAEASDDIGLA